MKKTILLTFCTVLAVGQSYSQGKGSKKGKDYVPVLEIPETTFKPSGIPIQEKYNGKIVFSNEQLTKENTTEDKFQSSFEVGTPIYARIFIPNQVGNYMLYSNLNCKSPCDKDASKNINDEYTLNYFIDDSLILSKVYTNNSAAGLDGVQTWQRIIYAPSLSSFDWNSNSMCERLNNLSLGSHKVKAVIWAGDKKRYGVSHIPIAEGEFDLTVSGSSKIKIGKTWSVFKSGSMDSDAKLKATLVELSKQEMKANYSDITIKEYKVLSNDYNIQKEYEYPKFRYVEVAAYGVSTSGKCFVYYLLFAQDYSGGGVYTTNFYKWGNTNKEEIDCE